MRALAVVLALTFAASAQADEIKVTGAHNCCGACAKAVHEMLGKVEGVSDITAEPKKESFTFDAANKKAARQALAALGRAGFYGKVEGTDLKIPAAKIDKATVSKLSLVGIHNCCPGCCRAAKAALADVPGVESDTLKPGKRAFQVEGEFDTAAVVKALNEAGFQVRKPRVGGKGKGKKKKNADKQKEKKKDEN